MEKKIYVAPMVVEHSNFVFETTPSGRKKYKGFDWED
jgi:hypothetical protein